MKRWIYAGVALLVIVSVILYSLLPSPDLVTNSIGVKTNTDAAYRILSQQEKWDSLTRNNFHISKRLLNSLVVILPFQNDSISVSLLFIPAANDSVQINWRSEVPDAKGPFKKWTRFSSAITIREKMENAMTAFRSFLQKDENIYGIKIIQTSTADTNLIATRFNTNGYPTLDEIYQNIQKLKTYAARMTASQTGYPMLNATKTDSNSYKCMVAIPINKAVADEPPVFFVRMIPGQFLQTTVKGGPYSIAHGHQVMEQYFKDYKRISMAIPFESIITDRSMEKDTTKWVTTIYGPVY